MVKFVQNQEKEYVVTLKFGEDTEIEIEIEIEIDTYNKEAMIKQSFHTTSFIRVLDKGIAEC